MPHPNELKKEKVAELSAGLEIWKVHVDSLKEQDVNARVMDKKKFQRLTANIKNDNRLESLPFCVQRNDRIEIVSGHHRVRASRMANVEEVFIILETKELTDSEIKSKQISHNSLNGIDDPYTLKKLWDAIEDIDAKIASGIDPNDYEWDIPNGTIDMEALQLKMDFKTMSFIFLPHQLDGFIDTMGMLEKDMVGVIADEKYDKVVETLRKISDNENIRNVSAVLGKMCDIVNEYYEYTKINAENEN